MSLGLEAVEGCLAACGQHRDTPEVLGGQEQGGGGQGRHVGGLDCASFLMERWSPNWRCWWSGSLAHTVAALNPEAKTGISGLLLHDPPIQAFQSWSYNLGLNFHSTCQEQDGDNDIVVYYLLRPLRLPAESLIGLAFTGWLASTHGSVCLIINLWVLGCHPIHV